MSFVGPRPLPVSDLPAEPADTQFAVWLERRHAVAPGITGLWQVSGRASLPFEEMAAARPHLPGELVAGMDLRILWRTLPVILSRRGAY